MSQIQRSPEQWFAEAAHWYAEKHQGCPWCKGANCVYKSSRRGLTEYRCGTCDFLVCLDGKIGRYFMGPGTTRRTVLTMHALAVFGPEESGPLSKR